MSRGEPSRVGATLDRPFSFNAGANEWLVSQLSRLPQDFSLSLFQETIALSIVTREMTFEKNEKWKRIRLHMTSHYRARCGTHSKNSQSQMSVWFIFIPMCSYRNALAFPVEPVACVGYFQFGRNHSLLGVECRVEREQKTAACIRKQS